MTTAEKLTTIAENQKKVYEAGKEQRDYEVWDAMFPPTRRSLLYAFYGAWWTDDLYNPVREISFANAAKNTVNTQFAYLASKITDTKVPINVAYAYSQRNDGSLFSGAKHLKTVRKLIVNENTSMDTTFTDCSALENLTIEGAIGKNANFQWCPLTKASILSVYNALSTTATGVTCTFKTSAVNTAFETAPGAADGSTSAEWTALVDSKQNWTFALSD